MQNLSFTWAKTALAERGVTSEDVGRRAGEALVEALATGACVDEWLQVAEASDDKVDSMCTMRCLAGDGAGIV